MNLLLPALLCVECLFSFVLCDLPVWKRLWNDGDGIYNKMPTYGPLGTESNLSQPPAMSGALGWWDDEKEIFILFGGRTADYDATNALWTFNHKTRLWTWLGGSSTFPPSDGVLGVPSPSNWPTKRANTCAWTAADGRHCMYGGGESLADLWCWDGQYWTRIMGNPFNNTADYGIQGVPAATNTPGGRISQGCTTDAQRNLWMFGNLSGKGDLWKWDGQHWTWIVGASTDNFLGNYGTQGVPSVSNAPAGRNYGTMWFDQNDNLWLWGGYQSYGNHLEDLWRWDGSMWTWVSGSSTLDPPLSITSSTPSGRACAIVWTTPSKDRMWMYGGARFYPPNTLQVFEDLWTVEGGTWRYLGGKRDINLDPVVNGSLWPGARSWSVGLMDRNNSMYLFGGYVKNINYTGEIQSSIASRGNKGDLWRSEVPQIEMSPPLVDPPPIVIISVVLIATAGGSSLVVNDISTFLSALITVQQMVAGISLNRPARQAFSDFYNTLKYVNGDFTDPGSTLSKIISSIFFSVTIGILIACHLKWKLWQVKFFCIAINSGTLLSVIRVLWLPFLQAVFGLYTDRDYNSILLAFLLVVFVSLVAICLLLSWYLKIYRSLFDNCCESRFTILKQLFTPHCGSATNVDEACELEDKRGYLRWIKGRRMVQVQQYKKPTRHVLGFLGKYWNYVQGEQQSSTLLWNLANKTRELISFRSALVEAAMDLIFVFLAAIMWDTKYSLAVSALLFMLTTTFMLITLPSWCTYMYIFYFLKVFIFWWFFIYVTTKEISIFWLATACVCTLSLVGFHPLIGHRRCGCFRNNSSKA